jgi:hypothetical protein
METARCRCARWPGVRCRKDATQEDLLCDGCREARCGQMLLPGQPLRHVEFAREFFPVRFPQG